MKVLHTKTRSKSLIIKKEEAEAQAVIHPISRLRLG